MEFIIRRVMNDNRAWASYILRRLCLITKEGLPTQPPTVLDDVNNKQKQHTHTHQKKINKPRPNTFRTQKIVKKNTRRLGGGFGRKKKKKTFSENKQTNDRSPFKKKK